MEKSKKTEKKEGKTFYEAVSATAVQRSEEFSIPKLNDRTVEFMENTVIFFSGTAILLVLLRIMLIVLGVTGGNLLTYLLYATSYPFVLLFNSSQDQVPALNNSVMFENIAIFVVYAVLSYGALKVIRALHKTN